MIYSVITAVPPNKDGTGAATFRFWTTDETRARCELAAKAGRELETFETIEDVPEKWRERVREQVAPALMKA